MLGLFPYLKKLIPNATDPEGWVPQGERAAAEMMEFAKNYTQEEIGGYADAQKEV